MDDSDHEQEETTGIVPAVVDAHVKSLLTALGGFSPDDPSRYIPGDSAIDCLRDLKRWLRLFDEKMNRLDVARCISTTTLARVDLPHIIRNWERTAKKSTLKEKLALSSLELLVLLTWPLDRDVESMTENHYTHLPALHHAQTAYKDRLLDVSFTLLQSAVKIQLPAMALDLRDRTTKDDGIVKMTLYLLRNVAQITPPPDFPNVHHKASSQRNALISAFYTQRVFPYLLTVASNMGEDFRNEDTLLLEILFHLVKRTNARVIFTPRKQRGAQLDKKMDALLAAEKAAAAAQTGRSRHSRFGTMVWMARPDGKMTTLAGQDALFSVEMRQQKLDASKKYRPPKGGRRKEMELKDMGPEPMLDASTMDRLGEFAADFLDAGFNPLFAHLRRSLEREAPQVMHYHTRQFFYVVAWFLKAELERNRRDAEKTKAAEAEGVSGFNLIASVLSQEMFIMLQRNMRIAYDNKTGIDLVACMRCFNQILLVVKDLYDSRNDADVEIADNILSRLFYEEDTQDLLAAVLRTYNGQGLEYLDTAIELVHNYTHLLSAYSSQNKYMQVRTKRAIWRNRKKAVKPKQTVTIVDDDGNEIPADDEVQEAPVLSGSDEDEEAATKVTADRKFDFEKFLFRFSVQPIVDTYVRFLAHYQNLDNEQLKRAHRYFFRLGFKQDLLVMMYRVDIINLLYEMIKGGRNALSSRLPVYKDWSELAMRIIRKCIGKLQERPALFVEMLFSKSSQTAYFLEHGETKKKAVTVKAVRVAPELEFRHADEVEEQICFLVRIMYSQGRHAEVKWVAETLDEAVSVRKAWRAAKEAEKAMGGGGDDEMAVDTGSEPEPEPEPEHVIKTGDEETRLAIVKNGHLRLFLQTIGIVRQHPGTEETIESLWIVPKTTSTDHLEKCANLLAMARMEDPTPEDAESALAAVRKKPAQRSTRHIESSGSEDDFEALFPAGGPTVRKAVDAPKRKAKKRRLRRKEGSSEEDELPDDEELAERARKRKEKEREKAMKVKSEMFVHSSDDDSDVAANDAEFWLREEAQRRKNEETALKAAAAAAAAAAAVVCGEGTLEERAMESLKRKKGVESEGEDGSDEEMADGLPSLEEEEDEEDAEMEMGDSGVAEAMKRVLDKEEEEEEEDVVVPARRNRTMGGFVIDSDDSE